MYWSLLEEDDWSLIRSGHVKDERRDERFWGRFFSISGKAAIPLDYRSLRPVNSDGAQTFTFSHMTVTRKHRAPVSGNKVYINPGPWQRRPSSEKAAVGIGFDRRVSAGRRGAWYVQRGAALPSGTTLLTSPITGRVYGFERGDAADFQSYIERDDAVEQLPSGGLSSVGNIAEDETERRAFWEAVENWEERVDARVQSRIIAEVPYETTVGPEGRKKILEAIGQEFEAEGLRWHGVVHLPGPDGDPRNYHIHIIYHDRAAWRDENGLYRFAEKKSPAAREYGFVKRLRSRYADILNEAYEKAGLDKRVDPRSYEEMGIEAVPGRHMGKHRTAISRKGVATPAIALANRIARVEYDEKELSNALVLDLTSDRKLLVGLADRLLNLKKRYQSLSFERAAEKVADLRSVMAEKERAMRDSLSNQIRVNMIAGGSKQLPQVRRALRQVNEEDKKRELAILSRYKEVGQDLFSKVRKAEEDAWKAELDALDEASKKQDKRHTHEEWEERGRVLAEERKALIEGEKKKAKEVKNALIAAFGKDNTDAVWWPVWMKGLSGFEKALLKRLASEERPAKRRRIEKVAGALNAFNKIRGARYTIDQEIDERFEKEKRRSKYIRPPQGEFEALLEKRAKRSEVLHGLLRERGEVWAPKERFPRLRHHHARGRTR